MQDPLVVFSNWAAYYRLWVQITLRWGAQVGVDPFPRGDLSAIGATEKPALCPWGNLKAPREASLPMGEPQRFAAIAKPQGRPQSPRDNPSPLEKI